MTFWQWHFDQTMTMTFWPIFWFPTFFFYSCQNYMHLLRILIRRTRNWISWKCTVFHLVKHRECSVKSISWMEPGGLTGEQMTPYLFSRARWWEEKSGRSLWLSFCTAACFPGPSPPWRDSPNPSRESLSMGSLLPCTLFLTRFSSISPNPRQWSPYARRFRTPRYCSGWPFPVSRQRSLSLKIKPLHTPSSIQVI